MTVICDKRESETLFHPKFDDQGNHIGGCHRREFLKVGINWSYDFRVEFPFKPGEDPRAIKFERKRFPDYVASFTDGKLERQVSYVDALIVEFDPEDVMAVQARYDGDPRDPVGRAMKRLSRMAADEGEYRDLWVIFSMSPQMTLEHLLYIDSGKALRGAKSAQKKAL